MLKKFINNNALLALIILGVFLATNRYIYGWDDQALELPLLKRLIDPSLYPGDYYVNSLQENFTSYLYPILSKLIKVAHIPAAYFVLYLISRYVFFFYSLKLWMHISKSRFAAVAATLMSFLIGRTEEFLYRTFSHQEFALAIIMAGLYYFYRERFIISAVLFGIAANFNALYALFPMIYVCTYLLFAGRFKRLIISGMSFVVAALPFLIWMLSQKINAPPTEAGFYDGWQALFMQACPQNYIFQDRPLTEVFSSFTTAMKALGPYLFLIVLYAFNCVFNPDFRQDLKNHALCFAAMALVVVSFVFSYPFASRFFIDLNLIRNTQYLNFILMGFTTIWLCRQIAQQNFQNALWGGVLFNLLMFRDLTGAVVIAVVAGILMLTQSNKSNWLKYVQIVLVLGVYWCVFKFSGVKDVKFKYLLISAMGMLIVYAGLCLAKLRVKFPLARAFAVIPLFTMFVYFCYLHVQFVRVTQQGGGFWQMQRNWEDMQAFVKNNTATDALIFVPHNMEMGGFRIGSERTIIASYRDCGIVGFDYGAIKEWQQRMSDIGAFKVFPTEPIQKALIMALGKYQADYIVFTKLTSPKTSNQRLSKQYENEVFTLFKVNR